MVSQCSVFVFERLMGSFDHTLHPNRHLSLPKKNLLRFNETVCRVDTIFFPYLCQFSFPFGRIKKNLLGINHKLPLGSINKILLGSWSQAQNSFRSHDRFSSFPFRPQTEIPFPGFGISHKIRIGPSG